MNEKHRALLVTTLLLGAVASPALRAPADDGFPLSTYPMFSRARQRTEPVTTALAIAADGTERIVPAPYVANVEPMQAVSILGRSVKAGRRASEQLCREIAGRVARSDEPGLAGAAEIVLATREIDAIAFLAGAPATSGERVHARCPLHPKPKRRAQR